MEELLKRLPEDLAEEIQRVLKDEGCGTETLQEIRLMAGRQGRLLCGNKELFLQTVLPQSKVERIFGAFLDHSVYARQEELRNGFLTGPGGCRIGVCGKAVLEEGKIKTLREISSLTLRRARALPGIGGPVAPALFDAGGRPYNTLIVSPPGCGKTTLLRDLVRIVSETGFRVALCDERSEVAGCQKGIPAFDLGPRTDVLDGCPKAEGMVLLLRAMGPEVIAADEIGRDADREAVETILCAGVRLLVTLHGGSYRDVLRSRIGDLVRKGAFQRLVFLGAEPRAGTVTAILDETGCPVNWEGQPGKQVWERAVKRGSGGSL